MADAPIDPHNIDPHNEDDDGEGAFPNMREVLDANPVAGGSQSVADDDDEGGRDQRWGASRLP